MANKLGQTLRQEQGLSLSPAQLLSTKLIELTSLELEARIEHELEDNPALEEGIADETDPSTREDDGGDNSADEDWDLGDYASEDDIPEYRLAVQEERDSHRENIPFAASSPGLDALLMEQLRVEGLEDEDEELARYIIGNISDDGYLTRQPLDLQDDLLFRGGLDVPLERIEALIERIRQLEPAGIGAVDLRDCLILQLERRADGDENDILALELLRNHYPEFVSKHFDRITAKMGISRDRLSDLYAHITRLNPKPAIALSSNEADRALHYNPDFIITEDEEGTLVLTLVHERELRPLRLNQTYSSMLADSQLDGDSRRRREAREFLKHKINQAQYFIEALSIRHNTLRTTMHAIMMYQQAFISSGEIADLRPMLLKDIAEITGLDISTISRVSSSKSVETPHGIYPLKYFFGEGISTDDGEEVSKQAIKQRLVELIDNEDKQSPLTDEALTALMNSEGYQLSRRTIAKYRDQLRIPKANLRRKA